MELRQIQYFVALYEEGSVTQAARRANVVQPAISTQLSKLERELGQPLFRRLPTGMVPTQAGDRAYKLFVPILQSLADAKRELGNPAGEVTGSIAFGTIASLSNRLLSECLASFHARFPKVTIHATCGFTCELLEMLGKGQLDLAMINETRDSRVLKTIEILSEDLFIVGAANTPLPIEIPATLQAAAGLDLVIPSRRNGLRTIIDQAMAGAGVKLAPRLEFDEIDTIEEFVLRTDFMTILPPIAVQRGLLTGALSVYPISPPISRTIICAYSPRRGLSEAAELLVEELKARMARKPGRRRSQTGTGRKARSRSSSGTVGVSGLPGRRPAG